MSFIPELSALSAQIGSAATAPDANGQSAPLRIQKISSWQKLEALSSEWDLVVCDAAKPTIFATREWLGAWWKAFGKRRQLLAFSFSNCNGETVGLAPLYLESFTHRVFGRLRRLRLVGDGTEDSDNLDLIVRSGYEVSCAKALLAQLEEERGWDICELNTLGENSSMAPVMLSCIKETGWPARVSRRPGSVVALPDTWEAYLSQLSHEHAAGIERYTRRLNRRHAVRIHRCATDEELAPSLEVLFELHGKRWQTRGEMGSFANSERRQFYAEMSQSFLRNGWLEFWMLELDGKPAAAQFAFRYGSTAYQLQEGLDPAHFSDRAGVVLRAHILKTLIAEGARNYDFLGGIDAHKKSWGAQPSSYVDICFARAHSRGAAHLFLNRHTQIAKGWLRTHLPSAVVRSLRKIA